MKRVLALLLCITFFITGCSIQDKDNPKGEGNSTSKANLTLVSNGIEIQNYKIVISDDSSSVVKYAADELVKYIASATGNSLSVVTDAEPDYPHEIILGKTSRKESNGISTQELSEEGFNLKTVDKKLCISSDGDRGILYGVYSFLELLGFRFYTPTVEKIPDSYNVFIPNKLDKTEKPVFDYREVMYANAWDGAFSAKQKINGFFLRDLSKFGGSESFAGREVGLVHTFQHLVPAGEYFATNPDYYSLVKGERTTQGQLCLTNPKVVDVVVKEAIKWIEASPDSKYISISQNDTDGYCECSTCAESDEKYNHSGTLINFVNKVAQKINQRFSDIQIITLAYGYTLTPPKDVKPDENVIIEICTSVCHSHTIEENCKDELYSWDGSTFKSSDMISTLNQWKKITNKFFIWDYVVNYLRLNAPFPNFHTLRQNMNLFAKIGTLGIYNEGLGYTTGEFDELRAYLLAKLSWNPYMTEDEYNNTMNDFLEGYYGEGYKSIREYIDTMCDFASQRGLSNNADMTYNLPISFDTQTNTYDLSLIDKCKELFDEALLVATDEQILRIKKSRIQLTYYELYSTMEKRYTNGSPKEKETLASECRQLYKDMKTFDIHRKVGNQSFNNNITDFTLSPKYW